ncbi:MAG TPA: NfeD family protein [Acidimicrobiales bacterium]|nr:NfeD family protein [Acidimicrobiales bacterium]
MWAIAGVLLGLVVLATILGFHAGPHLHLAAGVLGVVAAVWLAVMVADGDSVPVLSLLLGLDIVLSAGVGVLAWRGLRARGAGTVGHRLLSLEGAEGVAVGELGPQGIVRVGGEDWSAVSLNGTVPAGGRVQVIGADRVRLEVWGEPDEAADEAPPSPLPRTSEPAAGTAAGTDEERQHL